MTTQGWGMGGTFGTDRIKRHVTATSALKMLVACPPEFLACSDPPATGPGGVGFGWMP